MQYKPVLDAIEAILVADETANGLIGVYRWYQVEPGVSKTPACVIGASTEMSLRESYVGSHAGSRPRSWDVTISILVLGRSYDTQAQLTTEVEVLDATQSAVYTALNVDSSLTSTVTLSSIDRVHGIRIPGGEYFGHEILITAEKKEG